MSEEILKSASLVKFLSDPASYQERSRQVEVRETHISWVFLTETHAYKLKKPVKFDFLDFSTPDLRRQACEAELRLNRRLAPDVYLEVIPVTLDESGQFVLKGDGEQVDWAVKMLRLADDRSLEAMISAGIVSTNDVKRIGERLTEFYQDLPPAFMRPDKYRSEIDQHVRANRNALLGAFSDFEDETVKRVHGAQLQFLRLFPDELDERVCDGRIVEGHGDLRPEHIYLTYKPVVIDCIEFNAEFRQVDVLDELCFLAMECAKRDAAWIGNQIIEKYLQTSGDRPGSRLRAFYMSYRACVRAKVSLLRASQRAASGYGKSINEATSYLSLADELSHELGPPIVLIVRGPSGVGKTTLASTLADLLGAEHLQTDSIRREFAAPSEKHCEHNEGRYSTENRQRVYQAMFDRAEQFVFARRSVVLDGTFLTNDLQRKAVDMAKSLSAHPLLVNCSCPEKTAVARIGERERSGGSLSEARVATHERHLKEQESPPGSLPQCHLDTSYAMAMMTRTVFDTLRRHHLCATQGNCAYRAIP